MKKGVIYQFNLKKYFSNQEGSLVVEAILLSVPLIYIIMLIFEFSILFYTQSALTGVLINTGRQIQVGAFQTSGHTGSKEFKDFFCEKAKAFPIKCNDVTIDLRELSSLSGQSETSPISKEQIDPAKARFESIKPESIVILRVYYKWHFITPFIKNFVQGKDKDHLPLVSTSMFQVESYAG